VDGQKLDDRKSLLGLDKYGGCGFKSGSLGNLLQLTETHVRGR